MSTTFDKGFYPHTTPDTRRKSCEIWGRRQKKGLLPKTKAARGGLRRGMIKISFVRDKI